ncbi:KRAB-A domain-containing protein 2-like [Epargyreus clarus]|uniref:KRAB-A domain-containing protein 2-like n=1 Tax=Epargyreus clarus TaxID=520877 RepID=UPI003C2B95B1
MWPELSIVYGKPRHSQSQGSVERANQHVQQILFAWMEDNKTNRWSEGLRFCQLKKNCAYHHGIKQSPFEVMFGRKAHVGIETLPDSIKKVLQTEEELENAINSSGEKQNNTDDTIQRNEMEIPGPSSSTVKEDTSVTEKNKDHHIDKVPGLLPLRKEINSPTVEITSSDIVSHA